MDKFLIRLIRQYFTYLQSRIFVKCQIFLSTLHVRLKLENIRAWWSNSTYKSVTVEQQMKDDSNYCKPGDSWSTYLAWFPYFEKMKLGLCYLHAVRVSPHQPFNAWTKLYKIWHVLVYHGIWANLNCVIPKFHQSVYPSYRYWAKAS